MSNRAQASTSTSAETVIRSFQPGDEDAFRRLNEEWIERYFAIEAKDRETLENPRAILDKGGAILIAEANGAAVGCCALVPMQLAGDLELAKMAVTPSHQGRGLGKKLIAAAIDEARGMGASRLVLETNSKLAPALALYERMGFTRIESLFPSEYSRSDVWME